MFWESESGQRYCGKLEVQDTLSNGLRYKTVSLTSYNSVCEGSVQARAVLYTCFPDCEAPQGELFQVVVLFKLIIYLYMYI